MLKNYYFFRDAQKVPLLRYEKSKIVCLVLRIAFSVAKTNIRKSLEKKNKKWLLSKIFSFLVVGSLLLTRLNKFLCSQTRYILRKTVVVIASTRSKSENFKKSENTVIKLHHVEKARLERATTQRAFVSISNDIHTTQENNIDFEATLIRPIQLNSKNYKNSNSVIGWKIKISKVQTTMRLGVKWIRKFHGD